MNSSDDSSTRSQGGPQTVAGGQCDDETMSAPAQAHLDDLLDRALRDTFPCSDPISSLCVETLTHERHPSG